MSAPDHFQVGEIVVLIYAMRPEHQVHVGRECEVYGPLELRRFDDGGLTIAYQIRIEDTVYLALPDQLRRQKPPREPTCDWSDVPCWRPTSTEAA